MKGNLSTEGLYEGTRRKRSFSQLTQVLRASSILELQADHQAQSPGPQNSLVEPDHEGIGTQATFPPNQQDQGSESEIGSLPRRKRAKKNVNDGSNRVKKPKAYSAGTQVSPARPRRRASRLNGPTTKTSQSQPSNKSLWIRMHNDTGAAKPVVTHYDSSCNSSMISKSAALRLGLRTLPCTFALRLAVETDFGIVEPEEFVALDIEAPWLKDIDLGECYVTVVSGSVLESEGIEFLAGKRLLDKLRMKDSLSEETQAKNDSGFGRGAHQPKTMPSMTNGSDWTGGGFENSQVCGASDYLHPAMATRPQLVPSYITSNEEASYHSTHEAALDSTTCTSFPETQAPIFGDNYSSNQVFNEDDCATRFKSFGAEDQIGNYNLTREARGPRSESVFSQDVSQNTTRMVGPQFTAASPTLSQDGLGDCNSHTPTLPPRMWDVQMASPGYSFLSQNPQFLSGSAVATSSANNDRLISEGYVELQQGMKRWTSMPSYYPMPEIHLKPASLNTAETRKDPSPPGDAIGHDAQSQVASSHKTTNRESFLPSFVGQVSEESRGVDVGQIDDGKSVEQAASSGSSDTSTFAKSRTTDNAELEESERMIHSKPHSSSPLNERIIELSFGSPELLQGLADGQERLLCLISEIKHSNPVSMTLDYDPKTFLSDHIKIGVEGLTHQKWDWWPFAEPSRPLKGDEVRLEWTCVGIPIQPEPKITRIHTDEEQSCGKLRTDNVPRDFGYAMIDFVRQGCPSAVTSSTQAAPATSAQGRSSRGNSSNASSSNIPRDAVGASTPSTVDVQNNVDIIGAGSPQSVDTRAKHIFLVASCGSLQLHQIISTAQCTITFSDNLRRGYRQLRGFWRYWLSIYKFSHCDFFEFEKFCSSRISDIKKGLPPEESPYTEDYFYTPRPARSSSPISPKEFEHIYYHYRKTSAATINTWYNPFTVVGQAPFYWPRFFKQLPPLFQNQIDGNLPTDTVPKIPQRLTHFDELSNNRESFWGLHAREQISAIMVSMYTLLALMPWFAFCFVYIFGLGSNEVDIQNATTPLTISLTTVSLFIAWLVKH